VIRGGATYRVFSDHLGSPRVAVNVVSASDRPLDLEITAFGIVTGTGSGWLPQGFAGGLSDADTGFVRFGARDYDPVTGRWIAKDPIRFGGGTNLYVYAGSDPVNSVDSTGEFPIPVGIGIAAWTAFCHAAAYEQGETFYASDRNGGSSKRHCYTSCLLATCTLNPVIPNIAGLANEVRQGFSPDWRQDLWDNLRGSLKALDPRGSCLELCDPECPAQ
jgi:RHS repeat-associated protein